MARKMYVAIGPDKQQLEMCGHPKSSPYMQTAHLVFARHLKEAAGKARQLLGNPPRIIKQVGIFCADDLGGQPLNELSDKLDRIFVTDNNDTREGILIGMQNPKIGKRSISATKEEIRELNKQFKSARAGK